ncbi:MAG TPA: arsenate reductase family protein [Pseudogracilibacillus sp.]|nr:arsenate reductase family protein [Pseudogracilibacillus sp.]
MKLTLYWYPNCSTCKKAKKQLDEYQIDYETVHLVEETPTEAELQTLIEKSGLEPKKFFNTSGKVYRENNMKDKLKAADLNQMVTYLAADGMLIKRPIVTDGEKVTVGFNEKIFKDTWIKETDLNN